MVWICLAMDMQIEAKLWRIPVLISCLAVLIESVSVTVVLHSLFGSMINICASTSEVMLTIGNRSAFGF